jgi:hypothetical protein
MREQALAGTSIATTAASFPLAAVNDWLQSVSLVVAIVSGLWSIYLIHKRKR